jgi:hypothetical protein
MESTLLRVAVAIATVVWCAREATAADAMEHGAELRSAAAFADIADERARSVALFREAGKVIQSPRCLNCHPVEPRPTQGDDLHPHVPLMQGGAEGKGLPALPCKSCHGPANVATLAPSIRGIPGHARWGLAPASMAWQGKTLAEICAQLKDPARNGGHDLAGIEKHMATDDLVAWGWHPGEGRRPAPGTQSELGQLIGAWIATGAHCPTTAEAAPR